MAGALASIGFIGVLNVTWICVTGSPVLVPAWTAGGLVPTTVGGVVVRLEPWNWKAPMPTKPARNWNRAELALARFGRPS